MKFLEGTFWRQRGDCCRFFKVAAVLVVDDTVLKVEWFKKDTGGYSSLGESNIRITDRDSANFTMYTPQGDLISANRQKEIS